MHEKFLLSLKTTTCELWAYKFGVIITIFISVSQKGGKNCGRIRAVLQEENYA